MTPTQAEETVARLQRAASAGVPLPIPGARESRMEYPEAPANTSREPTGAPYPHGTSLSISEQLECERSGGGAPSERRGVRRKNILVWLWRHVFHPAIFSPAGPERQAKGSRSSFWHAPTTGVRRSNTTAS
jgi:hypothetical protein